MALTESMQFVPEQSTAALVVHHPQAKYFSVLGGTGGRGGAPRRRLTPTSHVPRPTPPRPKSQVGGW